MMFSRTDEITEFDELQDAGRFADFFGDENAAENAAALEDLRERMEAIEAQITSQFTSLATYTQIAQEQVEFARGEARAHARQVEQRLTSLIERERADRIDSEMDRASDESDPRMVARLDALELEIAEVRRSLDEHLARQRALAQAITRLFAGDDRSRGLPAPTTSTTPVTVGRALPPPRVPPATLSA